MYCKHCGKEITNDSTFCNYCGMSVSDNFTKQTQHIVVGESMKRWCFLYTAWGIFNIVLLIIGGKGKDYTYEVFGDVISPTEYFLPFWDGKGNLSFDLDYYDWSEFVVYVILCPLLIYYYCKHLHKLVVKWFKNVSNTFKKKEIEKKQDSINRSDVTSVLPPPIVEKQSASIKQPQPINNSKGMFRRLFTWRGRIRRTEFCISYILFNLYYFVMQIYISMQGWYDIGWGSFIFMLFASSIMIFQQIKRSHDMGHSGWFVLIPVFNPIWLMFAEGDDDVNEYGTNPKIDFDLQVEAT